MLQLRSDSLPKLCSSQKTDSHDQVFSAKHAKAIAEFFPKHVDYTQTESSRNNLLLLWNLKISVQMPLPKKAAWTYQQFKGKNIHHCRQLLTKKCLSLGCRQTYSIQINSKEDKWWYANPFPIASPATGSSSARKPVLWSTFYWQLVEQHFKI